jgi:glycosyltransferase involved in cell wall biosynthesis
LIKKPTIFACIPALNEQVSIAPVIIGVQKFVDQIFVCDDGSSDFTAEIALSLGAHLIRHQRNLGKGAALRSLFNAIEPFNPDIVVVVDADGQHNPGDIPKVIEPILEGEADFVVGSRFMDGRKLDAPFYRRFGLRIINSLTTSGIKDTQSGLRAFSRKALEVVEKSESNGYGVETEQVSLAKKFGLRVREVPVNTKYGGGLITSKKNPVSHGLEIISTIIRLVTEDRPLWALGVPACVALIVSMVSGYYLLFYYGGDGYFSIPWAFLFFFDFLLTILLSVSALFLYSIKRVIRKFDESIELLNKREQKAVQEST